MNSDPAGAAAGAAAPQAVKKELLCNKIERLIKASKDTDVSLILTVGLSIPI
jgi:hypothetical protein